MKTQDKPEISETRERQIIAGRALLTALDNFEPSEKFDILIFALMTALTDHTADDKVLYLAVETAYAKMLAHVETVSYLQARREMRSAVLQ